MRGSFWPGIATVLYYVAAIPITIALGILYFQGALALSDTLVEPNGVADPSPVVFFLLLAPALLLKLSAALGPLALFFFMLWLGRRVRAREQHRRQIIRDASAGSIASAEKVGWSSQYPDESGRYVLYLRPFSSTAKLRVLLEDKTMSTKKTPVSEKRQHRTLKWSDLETTLAEALGPVGGFIALGRPGEHLGAGRVLTDEDNWKSTFMRLAHGAKRIILVPSTQSGTKWELAQLLADNSLLTKTVFLIPPDFSSFKYDVAFGRQTVEHQYRFEQAINVFGAETARCNRRSEENRS